MLKLLLILLHFIDIALPVAMGLIYFSKNFEFKQSKPGYAISAFAGISCIAVINPARIKAHTSLTTETFRLLNNWQRDIRLIIFILVFLLTALYFVHGTFAKKAYHTLQFTFSYIICEYGFALTAERVKSRYDVNTVSGAMESLLQYVIFSVIVYLIFMVQLRFFLKKSQSMNDSQYILMSPMLIILLTLIMLSLKTNAYVFNMTFFILSMALNLCILALYRNFKETADQIARGQMLLSETRFYQEQVKGQKELSHLRHDMKNMLLGIRADLDLEDYKDARSKIDEIVDDISSTNHSVTGVSSLDAIIWPKIARIRQEEIRLAQEYDLTDAKPLQKHAIDLSIILGNLMDNAIEGTLRYRKEEDDNIRSASTSTANTESAKSDCFINIHLMQKAGMLTILIANSAIDVALARSMAQPSSKGKGRTGIGMESIRERTAALGGYSHFDCHDGVFEAMVQIPLTDS